MLIDSATAPLSVAGRVQGFNPGCELFISLSELLQTLLDCQADDVAHRDEAAAAQGPGQSGWVLRSWCAMMGACSIPLGTEDAVFMGRLGNGSAALQILALSTDRAVVCALQPHSPNDPSTHHLQFRGV